MHVNDTLLIWANGCKLNLQGFPNLEYALEYIVVMFFENKIPRKDVPKSHNWHNCMEHPADPLKCLGIVNRICNADDIKMFIDQLTEIHIFQPLGNDEYKIRKKIGFKNTSIVFFSNSL